MKNEKSIRGFSGIVSLTTDLEIVKSSILNMEKGDSNLSKQVPPTTNKQEVSQYTETTKENEKKGNGFFAIIAIGLVALIIIALANSSSKYYQPENQEVTSTGTSETDSQTATIQQVLNDIDYYMTTSDFSAKKEYVSYRDKSNINVFLIGLTNFEALNIRSGPGKNMMLLML